ncbi:hypothetical protein Arub01_10230 [Actinomadura rubrobrunea]|uniref:Uncharacterized protein n=1 Tax=Actinomadura rubrobrunea TaxID=115335 RepID=A0A9W6UTI4_9ACTN|nr:hypothetical protein Arub01_10230 [Actinomadura rubrobrunea]
MLTTRMYCGRAQTTDEVAQKTVAASSMRTDLRAAPRPCRHRACGMRTDLRPTPTGENSAGPEGNGAERP